VEVTVEDLERFLKSDVSTIKDVETIKTGVMLADEASIGDEAMEMLCEALDDEAKEVCRSAAWVLGNIGDTRAVEPLIKALGDDSYGVVKASVGALGKIGDERAVEPLIKELGGDDWFDVAEALGRIGDARAVEALAELIFDEDRAYRPVIEALGKIGDTRVIGNLIYALEVDCERLGEMECSMGCKREGFGIGYVFLGNEIMNAIIKIGSKEAIDPLLAILDSGIKYQDWQLPGLAIEGLISLGWKPETDEQKGPYLIATKDWEGCKKTGEPLVTKAVLYLEGPLHVYPYGHAETTCPAGCCGDYWFQESKDVMKAVDSFGKTAIKIFKANECQNPLYSIANGAKALKVREDAKEALRKLGHEVE